MQKFYRISMFLLLITATVGLYLISNECHKLYKEVQQVRITIEDATDTARGVTKKLIEEMEIVREKGTRIKFLFF